MLALAVRFAGISHLVPCVVEPDSVYVVQVRYFEGRAPELARHEYMFDYPRSVSRVAALLADLAPDPPADAPMSDHVAGASREIVAVRCVVAALAVLAVPATWFIARMFLPAAGALLAALLVAINLLDVNFSAQARPHAAVAGVGAAALASALALRRRPRWSTYVVAGAAGAAAFAVLHNGIFLILPLFAAHFLRDRSLDSSRGGGDDSSRARSPGELVRLALLAVPFALCVVFFYADVLRARSEIGESGAGFEFDGEVLSFGSHHIPVRAFNGGGSVQMIAGLWSFDPVFCVLALSGLAIAAWSAFRGAISSETKRDLAVVLAFGIPYALVFGTFRDSYSRFALPLVPLLAIPAALAFLVLVRCAARAGRASAVATALVLSLALGAGAVKLAWLRTQTDTVERAARWTRAVVVPERERVWLQPGLELPLLTTDDAAAWNAGETPLAFRFLWMHYLARQSPAPPGEPRFDVRLLPRFHEPEGDRWTADPSRASAALDGDLVMPALYGGGIVPNFTAGLIKSLAEHGALLARFAPIGEGSAVLPLLYDVDPIEESSMLVSVLRARCLGPVIDVFRVGEQRLRER